MKKLLLLVSFLTLNFSIHASNGRLDSLLAVLDKTIQERPIYDQETREQILLIEKNLQQNLSSRQRFNKYSELFGIYKYYQMDSALQIVKKQIELAKINNDEQEISIAKMNHAEVMMTTGMYKETFDILQAIDRTHLGDYEKSTIYHLYHSLYILLASYSFSQDEREEYKALELQYKDSILSVLTPDNLAYYMVKGMKLLQTGHVEEALKLALACGEKFKLTNHEVGMTAYNLSEIYMEMGQQDQAEIQLAISAIGDIRSGVKEYISLRKLAILLYEDGDIERAYTYIKCSMEDALFCSARMRTLEISQMLPIINSAYDQKVKQEKERLNMFILLILGLLLVLIVAISYTYKQMKALAVARRSLREINQNLTQMNEDLNNLNRELSESNRVKEEYIGHVFNMCSVYIDKLEDVRKNVYRKLKVGQVKEVLRMTDSSSTLTNELKEFYKSFDMMFLNLYPNFVEEFNSLLLDKEQIIPRDGELLSPELRIFALVRLGISDSTKIASFLHYSSQTVYNYRLKVRNKAKIPKEDFSDAIKQIGILKY